MVLITVIVEKLQPCAAHLGQYKLSDEQRQEISVSPQAVLGNLFTGPYAVELYYISNAET